jgi:hypothetical protein
VPTVEVSVKYLKALHKAAMAKGNDKRHVSDGPTVEVTVEYLTTLRREVGRHIDPDTAEVDWAYAQVLDPYDDDPDLPLELQQTGREYFARYPGRGNLWIRFSDLPNATHDQLLKKHEHKLAFPAGLFR